MKTSKRIAAFILAFAILIAAAPITGLQLNASAANGVARKIQEVVNLFGNYSYFSVNGRACTHNSWQTCSNCMYENVANNRLGWNWGYSWSGWTCCGFTYFVTRYVYGSIWKHNSYSVGSAVVSDRDACNRLMSQARIGDVLVYGSSHYAIFLRQGNGGWYVYDANQGNGHTNEVRYDKYNSCDGIIQWYKNSGMVIELRRMNNYDAINGVDPPPVSYSLSNHSASNISNTSATISFSVSPSTNPSAWGFKMNGNTYTVSTGNLSCDVATYAGKLQPGKSYSYKMWADIGGKRWESGTSSFTTTNTKPGSFTARISADNADIGIDDAPTVTWTKSNYTDSYTAVLYDAAGNTVQKKENISASATQFTFNPMKIAGNYTVKITAKNTAGSLVSNAVTLTVHPDVTVTFMDADPQSFVDFREGDSTTAAILGTSTVHFGKNASAPADPSHTGYTFKSWDSGYSSVKADKTVTATYTINTYTVTFKDVKDNTLEGGTQKVPYYSAATAPAYTPSKPAYIHAGWDKDFSCVTKNMTVTAIEKWYNDNYAVFAEVNSAVRDDTNKGYDVTVTLQNNENKLTTGRLVLVLKTTDGKMLTSSESAAFNLKPNASRSFNEFIPYENAAAVAYAYVVESYGSMIPIAQEASANVDNGLDWTSWSTEPPAEGTYADGSIQTRTEYRYKTRSTTTSYATSMPGWTRGSYKEVLDSSGTIDYVTSWPSGFYRGSSYFNTYNRTPKSASETEAKVTRVSTSQIGYLYWHWCRGTNLGASGSYGGFSSYNRRSEPCQVDDCNTFHAFFSGSAIGRTQISNGDTYFDSINGTCQDTRWWYGNVQYDNLPVYRCTWKTYNKLYTYTKVNDWTDWSTEPMSSYEEEDTRTVYRYRPKDTSVEDTSGTVRTISGTLGTDFVNQQVTLYIYKIGEASDYSNEYLAQTQTDANGNYSFTFKLREEPNVQTGDFTVALGVEGSNSLIYLDPIEAPKKEYTVRFLDWNGALISEQKVSDGDDAVLPDKSLYGEREGYTFSHWSESNLNIREDKEIQAMYTLNTYTVVFVDWEARNVQIRTFNHGDPLIAPAFENTDESLNVVWDKLEEGYTTVTQNMVVCTEYNKRVCTVTFADWENNIISTQEVEYGTGAAVPELTDSNDDYTFLGWKDIETGETVEGYIITGNINIAPVYIYKASVEAPVASVESGTYTEPQTVELSCATEGATIFYTLDGSDPRTGNAKVYTAPITVKDYAELSFYAVCINHNDSDVFNNHYIINPEAERSDYLPFAELPDYVVDDAAKYDVQYTPGYQFKDTVTADTATAYNAYIQDGWKVESVEPSAWSDWADTQLFESDRINQTFETQEVEFEVTVDKFVYSRYAYTVDGETQYAKNPVDGFDCTEETVEVDKPGYSISGFIGVDPVFNDENGTPWFTRNSVTRTETRTKTQYRSRYNVYTLYKWDETVVYEVADGETRESRTIDMYTYAYPKYSYVTVVPDGIQTDFGASGTVMANGSLLIGDNGDLTVTVPEFYGYSFDKLYKDADKTQVWDLQNDRVTQDTAVYASYNPLPFTVTFAYADGTEIESQTVNFLDAATAPESIPLPPDYLFLGWDSEAYTCVTEDTIIHARYVAADEYATITLDKAEVSLLASTTVKLNAVASVAGKDILWSSDNEAVAFAEKDGTVRGVAPGTATITATVSDSGESAVCTVTVLPNKDANVCLLTNSSLGTDSEGYIREVKDGKNTVAVIKKEFSNDVLRFTGASGKVLSDEDYVGTGTVISLMDGETVLDSVTVVMTGDINGDGVINVRDAAMTHRALLGKESASHLQTIAMDCNGDGSVDNKDAAMILQVLVGKAVI